MEVNLQIVGIFYNSNVEVPDLNPTIKSLLDAASANQSSPVNGNQAIKFAYTTNGSGDTEFASSFLAAYDKPVNGRVLGQIYPPGEYFLDEQLSSRPAYTVWQYYMFDSEGRYLNPYGKAIPFGEQSLLNVPWSFGGGSSDVARVTWRLVSILGQPTTPSGVNSDDLIAMGSSPIMRYNKRNS